MADFCKVCSVMMFNRDFEELAGLSTAEDTENGLYCWVLCEGCGSVQVDHTGKCISEFCEVCNPKKEAA